MNLALFDFDGTITHTDTFIDFMRYAKGPFKFSLGKIILSPVLIGFRRGLIPLTTTKQILISYCFKGWSQQKFNTIAQQYGKDIVPNLIMPVAHERIKWHQSQNDKIVVVTASIDAWLRPWCETLQLDLISSQLEAQNGRLTGKFLGKDCNGAVKPQRVRERYHLDDFDIIYAYGDSDGDRELLSMADIKYFNWQKIA